MDLRRVSASNLAPRTCLTQALRLFIELAQDLLRRGLVQIIASDAHDCVHRPPTLTAAYQAMVADYGEQVVRPMFVDNPHAVIRGNTINTAVVPLRSRRRWYRFWG